MVCAVDETIIDDGTNGIWTFDQLQGVVNVNVPVRMTVVKVRNLYMVTSYEQLFWQQEHLIITQTYYS